MAIIDAATYGANFPQESYPIGLEPSAVPLTYYTTADIHHAANHASFAAKAPQGPNEKIICDASIRLFGIAVATGETVAPHQNAEPIEQQVGRSLRPAASAGALATEALIAPPEGVTTQ